MGVRMRPAGCVATAPRRIDRLRVRSEEAARDAAGEGREKGRMRVSTATRVTQGTCRVMGKGTDGPQCTSPDPTTAALRLSHAPNPNPPSPWSTVLRHSS